MTTRNTSRPLVPLQLVVFLFTNDCYVYISFIRGRKVGLLSAKSNGAGKAPGKTSIKAQTSCKSEQEHKPSTSAGLPKLKMANMVKHIFYIYDSQYFLSGGWQAGQ